MENPIPWLLEGPAWVRYRTRLDLLGEAEKDAAVRTARKEMLADPQVQALLAELADWPGPVVKRHNDAGLLLHKLVFLADLGLKASDPNLAPVVERIMGSISPEGMFQVKVNIPTHFGGTGEEQWAWMLCDSPAILYALAKFGLQKDRRLQAAARALAGMIRANGWPCTVAPELGKFRGPGRKDDPCPYANLISLKALALFPEWRASEACRTGAEALLDLWKRRRETKPYLFGMGSDFSKLKAPLIWYDLLHVTDVLTGFDWLREDRRLMAMMELLRSKADGNGHFTPESVWLTWKEWEFGQKRTPSTWVTFLAWRILRRMEK
jgi:hypothetical protein